MWYCPAKKRQKLTPRWRDGVFLGRSFNTESSFIGLIDGAVLMARAMVRVVPSRRWDAERLLKVSVTPIHLSAATCDDIEHAVDPHRGPAGLRQDDSDQEDFEAFSRRVPILHRDLVKPHIGYSDGCGRYGLMRRGQLINA